MSRTAEDVGLIAAGIALTAITYGGTASVFVQGIAAAWATGANATILMGIGVSAGISGVFGLLQPLLNPSDTSVPGSQQNAQESAAYRRAIYGYVEVGGVLTFDSVPSANVNFGLVSLEREWRHQVYTVAGQDITSFGKGDQVSVIIDGISVALALDPGGSGYWIPRVEIEPYGGDGGFLGINFHIGFEFDTGEPFRFTSTSLPLLAAACPSTWTPDCHQLGCAKVHVAMRWDQNADGSQVGNGTKLSTSSPIYVNGRVPEFRFQVNGAKLADTRLPLVGGFTAATNLSNPALCIYDYLTNKDYGLGVDPSEIDLDSVNAAANICEETVVVNIAANGGSVSENLYSCNGVFDYSQARGDVLKALISSMAGTVVPPGDLWHVFAGSYNPPTQTLTDADLRDSIKGDFRISKRDICNGVRGTFLPAFLPTNVTQAKPGTWRYTDFPPYQGNGIAWHPNYILEDGGQIIWKEIRLGFTTSIWMAQRLAKIVLQLLRFQVTIHLACKLTAFQIQAGDTVTFIHDRWQAMAIPPPTVFVVTQATLVVDSSGDAPVLGVDLILRETDPSVYAFTAPTSSTNQGEYSSYGSLGVL